MYVVTSMSKAHRQRPPPNANGQQTRPVFYDNLNE